MRNKLLPFDASRRRFALQSVALTGSVLMSATAPARRPRRIKPAAPFSKTV